MDRLSGLGMPHILPTVPRPPVDRASPTNKEWGWGEGRGREKRGGKRKTLHKLS